MPQAKGVLPRDDDRQVLLRSPHACGYFIGVTLDGVTGRAAVVQWLGAVDALLETLVAREAPVGKQMKGDKTSSVAVGLSPAFFQLAAPTGAAPDLPASFLAANPLPPVAAPPFEAQVLFYVVSVYEARVNDFLAGLAALGPGASRIRVERGYQRADETEPFGYRDGVRNARPKIDRLRHVFIHQDKLEADEPDWADGGSYMAYIKIRQHPAQFAALLDDPTRDNAVGRTKAGKRLDLIDQDLSADQEPRDVGVAVPPASHVRKTGPRGGHDDVQIYRRGMPYLEPDASGALAVGLQFCSFQASLEQFDVILNDWSLNPHFPQQPDNAAPGMDSLLDPARGLVALEHYGFYFVPPHHASGLAAALFREPGRPSKTGRLLVRKRVVSPGEPQRRFDRRGFVFQVFDPTTGQPVGDAFTTDSTGRGVCPVKLDVGSTYELRELSVPRGDVTPTRRTVTINSAREVAVVVNQVNQPNGPYGAAS